MRLAIDGVVCRIVCNWRRQCRFVHLYTRCMCLIYRWPAALLQLPKLDVAGSIPVSRSILSDRCQARRCDRGISASPTAARDSALREQMSQPYRALVKQANPFGSPRNLIRSFGPQWFPERIPRSEGKAMVWRRPVVLKTRDIACFFRAVHIPPFAGREGAPASGTGSR